MRDNKISNYRFLLAELVKKGIKLKYRRSYLGIVWSLIEPILTTSIFVIVFGTLFQTNNKNYPLYIITGRLLYSFFSTGTSAVSHSIRQNMGMITKVYVPKIFYPLSSLLYNFIITLISFLVLIGVFIYCGEVPTLHIFQFIPAIILLLMLTFGVGLILCTLHVYFRDVEYLWNVALLLILYMCAIFYYPDALLESKYAGIILYNPLYQIIKIARDSLMGQNFDFYAFNFSLVCSIITILIGLFIFNRHKDDFILHI